jgi:hypothetical protein
MWRAKHQPYHPGKVRSYILLQNEDYCPEQEKSVVFDFPY